MKTRISLASFILILFQVAPAFSQNAEKILEAHRNNFKRATIEVKLRIINEAASSGQEGMGPLYMDAVSYMVNNTDLLNRDPRIRELGLRAVRQIGQTGHTAAKSLVWSLFQHDREPSTRIAVFETLGVIGKDDAGTVENLNTYLNEQNSLFKTGVLPDIQLVSACIRSLGQLGDPSSFPVLFEAMILGYPGDVSTAARSSLSSLEGSLQDHLASLVETAPAAWKQQAVQLATGSDVLTAEEKAAVAHMALVSALGAVTTDTSERRILKEVRRQSVRVLEESEYSKAVPSVIRHFEVAVTDFNRGSEAKATVLEAVSCLGTLAAEESARKLTQYLDLINLYSERERLYDEQITLAVIRNLGLIADPVAFDSLMHTTYLDYSDAVKSAAREAVSELSW